MIESKDADTRALECVEEICLPESLPGIDMETGLLRMGQNNKLYKELLISFREKYADIGREVSRELSEANVEDAGRQVHTVKGLSGNLGAMDLYQSALELETGILKGCPEDYPPLLRIFKEKLATVIVGLSELEADAEDTAAPAPEMDMEKLGALLDELSQLLESDYIAAMEVLKELAPYLATSGISHVNEDFSALKAQVESFDTQAALQTLSALIKTISSNQV